MSGLDSGERQVSPTLDGIRRDHVMRYQWAAKALPPASLVADLACGIGYGSFILAQAGHIVIAIDAEPEAIAYAQEHYAHPNIRHICSRAEDLDLSEKLDAVISFETIEHIESPLPVLQKCRALAPLLIASVPNEAVFPHRGMVKFHFRHYRPHEFKSLIEEAGFAIDSWHGQAGKESDVEPDRMGRTIIVMTHRADVAKPSNVTPIVAPAKKSGPKHVSIVGLGPSDAAYMDMVKRLGGRHAYCDETWAINAHGDVLAVDRIFHMDDVRIQESRAAARPGCNIDLMLQWMKKHPGPIYTSRTHPDYPGLVAFPLEDVLNKLGYDYFNNTAAYAIAYAIYLGVEKISFFGCDFTYPDASHAERGRGCCEYWIGVAMTKGIQIVVTGKSTLLDAYVPPESRLYGYDTVDVAIVEQPDQSVKVEFTPRAEIATAEEIEERYDHSRPPHEQVA